MLQKEPHCGCQASDIFAGRNKQASINEGRNENETVSTDKKEQIRSINVGDHSLTKIDHKLIYTYKVAEKSKQANQ